MPVSGLAAGVLGWAGLVLGSAGGQPGTLGASLESGFTGVSLELESAVMGLHRWTQVLDPQG